VWKKPSARANSLHHQGEKAYPFRPRLPLYLWEDTLKPAVAAIVNFQYRQLLSQHWGGTLFSSDGQRFPVAGKATALRTLPRYFGYGRGVTFYTWTSDQFSQYGTKAIPATVRDAIFVLDEILDSETELPIAEHTTDTALAG
jgi:TnpA family transposase